MNDSPTQGPLAIEVSDFGPIVRAEIDLRPLTVFVGPSNTGKSYLAILIYALHRSFGDSAWRGRPRFPRENRLFWSYPHPKLPRKTIDDLFDWTKQTLMDMGDSSLQGGIAIPASITDVIRSGYAAQGDQLGLEIRRCFGIDQGGPLIRKGNRDSARVLFRAHASNAEHRLTLKAQAAEFEIAAPNGMSMGIDAEEPIQILRRMASELQSGTEGGAETRGLSAWSLINLLAEFALPRLVGPLHFPSHYLPADRTGVMHAHSVVVSAMIGSAPMTGLRPAAGTPMLSGVLADFLQQLIEIDRPPYRRRRSRRDLGTQIEEAILGGSVRVDRSGTIDYPHFTYLPKGWTDSLPLMNASSMVSELAPVVLYLRHLVEPGSVLIIEEPESHLHPAMQVEFTRQLAALVQAGVRVIVTTHSEWVLEELANIVRRSELPSARRKQTPRAEFALRPDHVGAWLFEPKRRPRGSVVREIRLDDSGLYPSEFDEVARALHNDWADLSSWTGGAE